MGAYRPRDGSTPTWRSARYLTALWSLMRVGTLEAVFERFTDRARRVVVLAQEEARMLNHNYIGTEHILLGLIHEGEGVAAKALESLNISLEAVRQQVEEIIGQGQAAPTGHIPFTPRAKKVLELSLRESLQLGDDFIGTEHLLLGLTREGEGAAGDVLRTLGISLPTLRQTILSVRAVTPLEEPTPSVSGGDLVDAGEVRPSGPEPITPRLIETEAQATVLSPEIIFASRSGIRMRLSLVESRYGDTVRDWLARVEGDDLDARVTFSEAGWLPEYLSTFLMRLAQDEGWDESQTWDNGEGEFQLRAARPETDTVVITAQLFYQAPPLWTVEATMEMDPGAFAQIAAEVHRAALARPLGGE